MRKLNDKEAKATQKFLGYSYKKGNRLASKIRGKTVDEAIRLLQFSPQMAARATLKIIRSAMANAVENHGMKAEDLVVKTIMVNKAPGFKRLNYRARGRADRMVRHNNHTTVVLGEIARTEKSGPAPSPAG
jgi:large subunit ribosomal protein L22